MAAVFFLQSALLHAETDARGDQQCVHLCVCVSVGEGINTGADVYL